MFFSDASFRSDSEDRATTGVLIFLGGSPVLWKSRKQQRLAHATCDAELVAALDGWKYAEPIRQLLEEFGIRILWMNLGVDNSAAETILRTGSFKRSRYFEYDQKLLVSKLRRDHRIRVQHVPTADQLADCLTKPVGRRILEKLWNAISFRRVC